MAANVFLLENNADFSEKISIDELFDKKQKHDLNTLALYNKVLNRIHVRIKTTSRQKLDEQFCWFIVPEVMIGVPKYDHPSCVAYLISKLKENKFNVRYIHPNTLFISWQHWVPSYVRTEYKNKTGKVIDEFGNELEKEENNQQPGLFAKEKESKAKEASKMFTPINSYKPQGNFNDL
jgi:hypothetical protein